MSKDRDKRREAIDFASVKSSAIAVLRRFMKSEKREPELSEVADMRAIRKYFKEAKKRYRERYGLDVSDEVLFEDLKLVARKEFNHRTRAGFANTPKKIVEYFNSLKARLEKRDSKGKNNSENNTGEVIRMTEGKKEEKLVINEDTIKKAVQECLNGQCDLLNNIMNKIDSVKEEFSKTVSSMKQDIESVKEAVSKIEKPEKVDISPVSEKLKELEERMKKFDEIAEKLPDRMKEELDGITQETLKALAGIKEETEKVLMREVEKRLEKQEEKEEQKTEEKQPEKEEKIKLEDALRDREKRQVALKIIETAARQDKEILDNLRDLVLRCQQGDQQACQVVQEAEKKDEIKEMLEKIKSEIEELKQSAKKEELKKGQVMRTTNPLRERLFGSA